MDAKTATVFHDLHCCLSALYQDRLSRLILFGSRARGDADPASDVDVLVVLKGSVNPGAEISRSGAEAAALSLKHDVVVSRTFVSEDRFLTDQSPLLRNVRREGVVA
jgi:uncharacterized protein